MQLVTTFDELNDSKPKIHEKMHRWDKSLPRRRVDTTKRIKIALQWKGRIVLSNNAGEEEEDKDSLSINNDYIVKYIICVFIFNTI